MPHCVILRQGRALGVTVPEIAGGDCIVRGSSMIACAVIRHFAHLMACLMLAWDVLRDRVGGVTMKASKVKSRWSRWRGAELAEVGRLRGRLEAQLRERLLQALSEGIEGECVTVAVNALRAEVRS